MSGYSDELKGEDPQEEEGEDPQGEGEDPKEEGEDPQGEGYSPPTGYPPQGEGYPLKGYPAPEQGYPAPGQGYPAPGQGYPAPGQGYPVPGQGYPAPGQGYPPPGQVYPPQPGYGMQAGQPPSHPGMGAPVILQGSTVAVQVQSRIVFGPNPQHCVCPHCRKDMRTKTSRYPSVMCWVVFFLLIIFGCWLGCCLIPFCIPAFYAATHRCSHCGKVIGHYST